MYFYGEPVEGVIRLPEDYTINGHTYAKLILINGKFLLYGDFIVREVQRTTIEGKAVEQTEIFPVTGVAFVKLIDYVLIMDFFYDPDTGARYAYFAIVPEKVLRVIIRYFKFWDIIEEDLTKELETFEIEL